MNRTFAIAATILSIGFAAVSNDAHAEVAGPVIQRQAPKALPAEVKQARVETSGAKTFIINGRRVLVPSDNNAEAVIKALKARYPSLQAGTREARGTVTAIEEK